MTALEELRSRIDEADDAIIAALAERMESVRDILLIKQEKGIQLVDADREEVVLTRAAEQAESLGLDPFLAGRVLSEIISFARATQIRTAQQLCNPRLKAPRTIAYQGSEGAYSWTAAHRYLDEHVESYGFQSFEETVHAVAHGTVDMAILPVENTLVGSIHEVFDLLCQNTLHVVGEEVLRIEHCLIGLEMIPHDQIRSIFSHPVALQQCSSFLRQLPGVECRAYSDTAEAVRRVKADGDPLQVAVASSKAAEMNGLKVIRDRIADHPENFTRFWVVSREPVSVDRQLRAKTSLILVTDHREGALVECLSVLARYGVNMLKLESRPIRGTPWEYRFYLDVEGNVSEDHLAEALDGLRERARVLRVMGCYPIAQQVPQSGNRKGTGPDDYMRSESP